ILRDQRSQLVKKMAWTPEDIPAQTLSILCDPGAFGRAPEQRLQQFTAVCPEYFTVAPRHRCQIRAIHTARASCRFADPGGIDGPLGAHQRVVSRETEPTI